LVRAYNELAGLPFAMGHLAVVALWVDDLIALLEDARQVVPTIHVLFPSAKRGVDSQAFEHGYLPRVIL
jgi:hypothetical protein